MATEAVSIIDVLSRIVAREVRKIRARRKDPASPTAKTKTREEHGFLVNVVVDGCVPIRIAGCLPADTFRRLATILVAADKAAPIGADLADNYYFSAEKHDFGFFSLDSTLSEAGITSAARVHLRFSMMPAALRGPAKGAVPGHIVPVEVPGEFTVLVKTLTGKTVTLAGVTSDLTFSALKDRIQALEGIPPDQQRLVVHGAAAHDEHTLREFGIDQGTEISLILRLRGGMYHFSSGRFDMSDVPELPDLGSVDFSPVSDAHRQVLESTGLGEAKLTELVRSMIRSQLAAPDDGVSDADDEDGA